MSSVRIAPAAARLALSLAAVLCAPSAAFGYSATADVTFTWAASGTAKAWTSTGPNTFPNPAILGNDTHVYEQSGNNSTIWYNPDFAINSDYSASPDDDCLTPVEGYRTITLRQYACRITDPPPYYDNAYHSIAAVDAGPGAAATGTLSATDTTLTGTLTVISTTDEPSGATTTVAGGVRTIAPASASNGANGYNVRSADGSPFGNVWYGVTTSAQLTVNLTGTFTSTAWTINGGTVRINDPGFACQQGGFGGTNAGTLCNPSVTGGGFQTNGGHLSWGIDPDGAGTSADGPIEIQIRNSAGTAVISTFSGVRAELTLDGTGIATDYGEFRYASGSAGGGCLTYVRWSSGGITCGTLGSSELDITGVIVTSANTQAISGSMGDAVNSCFNIAVSLTLADCSYARTRVPSPVNPPRGPKITGAFYALGSAGDQVGYIPAPGDEKLQLPLTGTVTIDHNNTPSDGSDDLVSAQWTFGAGAHNAATGNGDRALERFTSWQHAMDATPVSSATPLQGGGFEYVIGSRGKPTPNPLCAAADAGDCFPSESAPQVQDPPGFWSDAGWNLTPSSARVGIERSPGFALGGSPNVGARTTGTFNGYQCIDDSGDTDCIGSEILLGSSATFYRNESGPPSAHPTAGNCNDGIDNDGTGGTDAADQQCVPVAPSQPVPEPGTPLLVSPPGFDNVVLIMRTDAAGAITSAEAYWTREYLSPFGPAIGTDPDGTYTADNSWGGGRFTFVGAPNPDVGPRANGDRVTVVGGTSTTLDVLANDSGLANTPLIVRVTWLPARGTATVLPDNRIQYSSGTNENTSDFFYYEIEDALGRRSTAQVVITVTEPPGPWAIDDQITSSGAETVTWPVLFNDQRLHAPPFTVEIVAGPSDGTATVAGSPGDALQIVVRYTSANDNTHVNDQFQYRVTDADGFSDTAIVYVDRLPKIGQDDYLTVASGDEEGAPIYVMFNDVLPPSPYHEDFTLGIFRNPQHGTVTVHDSPGHYHSVYLTYVPNEGFSGADSFEYAVDNERTGSTATVYVTVVPDADNDGYLDAEDNCVESVNRDQRDTNGDGYGNVCDADLDDNGIVNFVDLNLFRRQFGTKNPHADFNGSGLVNFADLTILTRGFGQPPGPAGASD